MYNITLAIKIPPWFSLEWRVVGEITDGLQLVLHQDKENWQFVYLVNPMWSTHLRENLNQDKYRTYTIIIQTLSISFVSYGATPSRISCITSVTIPVVTWKYWDSFRMELKCTPYVVTKWSWPCPCNEWQWFSWISGVRLSKASATNYQNNNLST